MARTLRSLRRRPAPLCLLLLALVGCDGHPVGDPREGDPVPGACEADSDCPWNQRCDAARCVAGCRSEPDSCPQGWICIDDTCLETCEPRGPDEISDCPGGDYCDPFNFTCPPRCFEHADCDALRFCDVASGLCIPGCRDDAAEPDNSLETAVPIDLRDEGAGRIGVADGRVVCGNDIDFYAVEIGPGERLRIELAYDPAGGDLDLRLTGDAVGADPLTAEGPAVPARIELPAAGAAVDRATVYVEVHPSRNDPLRRIEYRLVTSTASP